jgi:hypothetical protein
MDGTLRHEEIDAALARSVEADLTYLAAGESKPFTYTYDPPPDGMPARGGRLEERRVQIADARWLRPPAILDRQGFELHQHRTAMVDFYDEEELRRVYYPEIERLLRETSGAAKVQIFDHTLRHSAGRTGVRQAVGRVHNDYTDRSAPQRVRDLLPPDEAEARLARRYAEVNVWRSIASEPVETWPLALCDARSIAREDLVPSELRYPDRTGETYAVTWSPHHRWFYFPRMRRDEALLIKCFDSARDGRARLAVHSAFADPTTRPDAPPRQSIELRAFLFY